MSSKTKTILVVTLVVVAAAGLVAALYISSDSTTRESTESNSGGTDANSITADRESIDDQKAEIIKKTEAQNSLTDNDVIKPVVVYAGIFNANLEISAYVPIVESTGVCTGIVKNISNGNVSRVDVETSTNASTSDCNLMLIPVSELNTGSNEVSVEYNSERYSGVSEVMRVEIP